MKTIIATVLAKPGKVNKMKNILEEMAVESRKEFDCLKFDVFQKEDDSSQFILHEEWRTKEGFQNHFETEHFKRIGPKLFDTARSRPVTIVLDKIF